MKLAKGRRQACAEAEDVQAACRLSRNHRRRRARSTLQIFVSTAEAIRDPQKAIGLFLAQFKTAK